MLNMCLKHGMYLKAHWGYTQLLIDSPDAVALTPREARKAREKIEAAADALSEGAYARAALVLTRGARRRLRLLQLWEPLDSSGGLDGADGAGTGLHGDDGYGGDGDADADAMATRLQVCAHSQLPQ
eukprot:611559-Pleurochrysis_carterae.AAC.1